MNEGQRKSRVGRGMKPRGNAEETPVNETVNAVEAEDNVSSNEVQDLGAEQAENGVPETVETPPNQEAEMGNLSEMLKMSSDGQSEAGPQAVPEAVESQKVKPNGDMEVLITVPETYITSVKDFAADLKISTEQWCTDFFVMHLEAYCTPNKGR